MTYQPLAVVDLDNTLYAYEVCHSTALRDLLGFLADECRMNLEDVSAQFETARRRTKQRVHGHAASHSRLSYVKEFLSLVGLAAHASLCLRAEQIYWGSFMDRLEPVEGSFAVLAELRRRGYHVVIRTDMTLQIQLRKIVILGLEPLVDEVWTSEELGIEKSTDSSWQAFFSVLPENLGGNCLFVGDDLHDLGPVEPWPRFQTAEAYLIGSRRKRSPVSSTWATSRSVASLKELVGVLFPKI
jgi:FMN phosphatase YigB (HAD superfamily)